MFARVAPLRVLRSAALLGLIVALLGCAKRAGNDASFSEDAGVDPASIFEDGRRWNVRRWTFPLDRYDFGIVDAEMASDLGAILERTGAELVVNGGFYDKENRAVGLAVTDGKMLSPFSRTTTGGVLTFDGERARLDPTEAFDAGATPRFAVQCRPRLVVDGASNVKKDDGHRAERTALCVRDGGRTLEVFIARGEPDGQGPSLFAFGKKLADLGCHGALNLDGGPSTGAAWRQGDSDRVAVIAPRRGIRHAIFFKKH